MVLGNIKTRQQEKGFTIVELLIVVVVIGILAAITIVAYGGITNRANNTKAQTTAANVQKVLEAMNADKGYYPQTTADFFTGSTSTKIPAGIGIVNTAGTAAGATTNGGPTALTSGSTDALKLNTVVYEYCGAVAAPAATATTGGRIRYWDFATNALSTTIIYVGTGQVGLGAGAGTVCNTWVTPAT